MPAKSGKGGDQLIRKYANKVKVMTGPRTESAMAKILSIGMTGAKELTPVEYSTLINSSFRRIDKTQVGMIGVAGFTANYAIYLHNNTNWSPRSSSAKKGPGSNPNAAPKFLERGFTDPDKKAMMQRALGSTYKL